MEDSPWTILRGRMRPWQFQVFTLLFIVVYPMTLLVLITLPAWFAWQHPAPFGVADAILAAVFLGFLTGETIADQQWDFHRAKAAGRRSADPALHRLDRVHRIDLGSEVPGLPRLPTRDLDADPPAPPPGSAPRQLSRPPDSRR